MDIVDLVVFGLIFRFIMLDDLRDVTKVVDHFLRNVNTVLPALVDILFRVILTQKLEVANGLCDSVFSLVISTDQGTSWVA